MAIYLHGGALTLLRPATIEEAQRERDPRNRETKAQRRNEDARDLRDIQEGLLFVAAFDDNPADLRCVCLPFLKADGGWGEIQYVAAAVLIAAACGAKL